MTEGKILDLLEDCKSEMGIQTILGVVATDRVKSPALFGVIRPRLLLPEGILKTLSTEELRYVFLHELAHLKRHDIYLGWLMVILQILHWFNPLIWLAFHRMRADRELACDGLVLSTMGSDNSQAYGQTLVNLFKGFSQVQYVPGIAGILENKSQLKRRITMIARFKKGSYQWSVLAAVLLAVLGCLALTNAQGTTQQGDKELKALAQEFVELLVKGEFSKAVKKFDTTMKKSLPEDKLEETWKITTLQAGLFKQQLGVRVEKFLGSDIMLVTCEFQKGPMDVKIIYDSDKKVIGLRFVPTPQKVLEEYKDESTKKANIDVISMSNTNLLLNPGAEQETSYNEPSEWFKAMVAADGLRMYRAADESYGGKASFAIANTHKYDMKVSNNWAQFIDNVPVGKTIKLSAYAKTQEAENVNVCLQCWGPDKKSMLAFASTPILRGDNEWTLIQSQPTTVPPGTSQVCVRAVLTGLGKVWFDDISVTVTPDEKVLEQTTKELATTIKGGIRKAIPITMDLMILSYIPRWNFGNVDNIAVANNGGGVRTLLAWPQISPKDAKDPNFTFVLALYSRKTTFGEDPGVIEAYEILEQWFEHTSWETQPTTFRKPIAKFDFVPNEGWKLFDITTSIRKQLENKRKFYGLLLRFSQEYKSSDWSGYAFASREGVGEWLVRRPTLLVVSKAKQDLHQLSVADKRTVEKLAANGWVLWRQKKWNEAEKEFEKAVRKDPANAHAWNGLGWSQLNLLKKLDAKHSFEKVLEIEPKHPAALNGLGWIVKGQGKTNEAISYWKKAVSAAPNATAALRGLTLTYMDLKDYDKAIKYYSMWLDAEPDNAEAKSGLEKAQSALKDK